MYEHYNTQEQCKIEFKASIKSCVKLTSWVVRVNAGSKHVCSCESIPARVDEDVIDIAL